jgi:oxazoline/thiazoline dehydrogenase
MLRLDQAYKLSRFMLIQPGEDGFILSSPLNRKQFVVRSPSVFRLLLLLTKPVRMDRVLESAGEQSRPVLLRFVESLEEAGLLTAVDSAGKAEEETNSLAHWEPHDLLFHASSRIGRQRGRVGGTYRFKDVLPQEPAVGTRPSGKPAILLPAPDNASESPRQCSLAHALENRRSSHECEPLTLAQLSEFLYRCCRVTSTDEDAQGARVRKTYPSGGSLHPLEIYIVAHACRGLDAGLYHYSGLAHSLTSVCDLDSRVSKFLEDARIAAGEMAGYPAVLAIVSARFRRTAWKYEGIAYRLMLMEAGALFQSMYLVGEAMGLACCALGCGDSDLFSEVAGTDYYMETSIGEFMLSGRP